VPPALPSTARNNCLKESHEFACLLLVEADMRVVKIRQMRPFTGQGFCGFTGLREGTNCQVRTTRHTPMSDTFTRSRKSK
jgi:hypothetical protein